MTAAERRHRRDRAIARRLRQFGTVISMTVEREPGEARRRPNGLYSWPRPIGPGKPWCPPGRLSKTKPLNCSHPCCQSDSRPHPYRGKERQAVKTDLRPHLVEMA